MRWSYKILKRMIINIAKNYFEFLIRFGLSFLGVEENSFLKRQGFPWCGKQGFSLIRKKRSFPYSRSNWVFIIHQKNIIKSL